MSWWATLMAMVQVVSALGVIILVLIQHGKGADMGAAFGSGSSGSLFGATGSANFMSRATAGLATVFFLMTLGLAFVGYQKPQAPASVMETSPSVAPDVPEARRPVGSSEKSAPAGDIPK
jgi:preprotein translocase subunit SecG